MEKSEARFEQEEINQAIDCIWDFLCVREEPKKSDAIFVFGCGQLIVPRHAAILFQQKIAPVIIVSGAMGKTASIKLGMSECDAFYQELVKEGVPSESILLERHATNTGENIILGMNMLREKGFDPKAVTFVSLPYHSNRCKATFQLREPELITYSCPPPGDFSEFIAFTKERFVLRLTAEIDRLIEYPKQGLIVPQEIPIEVLKASELIKANVREL